MIDLPANLPSITNAKLPAVYERAKEALAECSAIDECQQWADKAQALASYAKQAKDDGLRKLADRIQARAIRRCGELLKTFDGKGNNQHGNGSGTTQREAANDAGLSHRQKVTAVRVANVPAEDFEAAVESDSPPTVTALAEAGKKTRPIDLGGIDPEDFRISTDAQDQLRRLAEFTRVASAAAVARGARPHECSTIRRHIDLIERWMDQLFSELED
jgi:hypothetical protein